MAGSGDLDGGVNEAWTVNVFEGAWLSHELDGHFLRWFVEVNFNGTRLAGPVPVLEYDERNLDAVGNARRNVTMLTALCDYCNSGGSWEELLVLVERMEQAVNGYSLQRAPGWSLLDYRQPRAEYAFCNELTGEVLLVRPEVGVTPLTVEQALNYADGLDYEQTDDVEDASLADIVKQLGGPPNHLEPS
mgnify:FL=1